MGAVLAPEQTADGTPDAPQPERRSGRFGALRTVSVVEWVALAAALVPIAVTVVRARLTGWMPLFDAGYFSARSRDVLTEHHPFVGAWSMGSKTVGESLNNLGPIQLDLLAPFTKLSPYWGTGVGIGVMNAAAVVGVWFVARRLFGVRGAVGAMIATLCLQLTMGSWMLIEARQQLALLLPFWCLLWLCAAMWTGAGWTLPWTAFVASLVLQTHFSFAYQTVGVLLVGIAGFALARRAGSGSGNLVRWGGIAAAVVVVCWSQTLWDQFFGTGNLARVLGQGGGSEQAVGLSDGLRFVSGSTLVPPFWLPGSMGSYLRPSIGISATGATLAILVWVAAMAVVVFVGRRTGRRPLAALGAIGATALAGAVLAASQIPPTEFGIVAYNYYWMWPIGIFLTTAVAAAVLAVPRLGAELGSPMVPRLAACACVLVALPVLRPVNDLPETVDEPDAGDRVGRPLMSELADALERRGIDGPVVIDRSRETHTDYFPYTMLAELQRQGVDFTFPPGDVNLARFGTKRCETGSARYRLILADGLASSAPRDGEEVLAHVDAISADERAELERLGEEFGELLRDGTITVDLGGLEFFGQPASPSLLRVLEEPGVTARGLGEYLANWRVFGVVTVPDDLVDHFLDWRALEERAVFDRVAIFLGPNLVGEDGCDAPGDVDLELEPVTVGRAERPR